jgi:hypothetical protein
MVGSFAAKLRPLWNSRQGKELMPERIWLPLPSRSSSAEQTNKLLICCQDIREKVFSAGYTLVSPVAPIYLALHNTTKSIDQSTSMQSIVHEAKGGGLSRNALRHALRGRNSSKACPSFSQKRPHDFSKSAGQFQHALCRNFRKAAAATTGTEQRLGQDAG